MSNSYRVTRYRMPVIETNILLRVAGRGCGLAYYEAKARTANYQSLSWIVHMHVIRGAQCVYRVPQITGWRTRQWRLHDATLCSMWALKTQSSWRVSDSQFSNPDPIGLTG